MTMPFTSPDDYVHLVAPESDGDAHWFVFRGDQLLVEMGPPSSAPTDDLRVKARPSWARLPFTRGLEALGIEPLRTLYLGTLALLNHRGFLTIHACKSNRDYERELRRRSRDSALSQIFRLNIRSFEQSWYGFHEVTGEQIQHFRDNLGRMRSSAA